MPVGPWPEAPARASAAEAAPSDGRRPGATNADRADRGTDQGHDLHRDRGIPLQDIGEAGLDREDGKDPADR